MDPITHPVYALYGEQKGVTMKTQTTLCILAFSTFSMVAPAVLAQDAQQAEPESSPPAAEEEPAGEGDFLLSGEDDFSLALEPAPKPAPVYHNFVELGIGSVANDLSPFTPYSGRESDGAFVTGDFGYYKRGPWDGDDLSYLEAEGERLGLKSRSLRGTGGVQGKYKLNLHYDQLPYYQYRSLTPYEGVGSKNLQLPSNWESNPIDRFNTATQNLPELSASMRGVNIKTERTRFGGGVVWNINQRWTAKFNGQREKKEGKKPLGIAWGTSGQNAAAVIVPEPIDYQTDIWGAEVGYRTKKLQFNLGYQLSQFENNKDTLSVENPFTYAGWNPAARFPTGIAEAQLAPDNKAHSFNLAAGYNVSDSTRLTGNLVYSRYLQDQKFLPYTSNPQLTVQEGVPRNSLDGEISNTIGNIELVTRPVKAVEVKARYRYTDRDNDTPRDQYIYVRGDAENQQIGGTEPNYRTNTPYSYREHLLGADVAYRWRPGTKFTVGYDYRKTDRDYQENSKTTEQTGRIDVRHRFTKKLSATAEYAHVWRDGSSYSNTDLLEDTYTQTYIDSLGDTPFINHPLTRAYYLADMTGNNAALRFTYMPMTALTFGVRGTYLQQDYDDTTVGLKDVKGWGANFDATYALDTDLSLTGYYSYNRRKSDQGGWSFQSGRNELEQINDPARSWETNIDDQVNTVGVGLNWRIYKGLKLSADYSYTDASTSTDTSSGGALEAGDFPDVKTRIHRLQSDLGYDLSDQLTLGLSYVYEDYNGSDWQTDGVTADTIGRVLSLEEPDSDYDNHAVVVWTRFKF